MGLSESFNFSIMLVVWWSSLNIQFQGHFYKPSPPSHLITLHVSYAVHLGHQLPGLITLNLSL
jgi:hypothetical protein